METTREDLVMTSAYDFCPSVQTVRVAKGRLHRGGDGNSRRAPGVCKKKSHFVQNAFFFRISYRNLVMCSLSKHSKNF